MESTTEGVALSGETEAQRREVCAAWNDLPPTLRAHPGLKRLYHALGGPDREKWPPIVAAPAVPPGEILAMDAQGRPVGRITGVGQ
jgi:hypothetical protein